MKAAEAELDEFIDKYTPEVATLAREILAKMRQIVPPCRELVYDNYNFLVVGFCPDERPSNAVFSIALAPRHVSLCFLQGAGLSDPHGLLRGSGNVVRNIRLPSAQELDRPEVRDLMELAMASAKKRFDPDGKRQLVIQSVSPKQRPRRPG
ncbi:MAG: hypothetical protein QOJ65_1799 [Fimbriimonadaceae bacterium]|jgi:hypothetical protein|nr:hypothetical protein [Fimbriimonadaceae bacterium]